MKVCIVGAGAAGLCAARHILAARDANPALNIELVVYEISDRIGGTWNYTPKTGTDDDGLPVRSSMYRDLRTNIPLRLMEFPDFPATDPAESSFVHHTVVREYLAQYADHFNLLDHVTLRHNVSHVSPLPDDRWKVSVVNLDTSEERFEEYDSIYISNGRYSKPLYPTHNVANIEGFKGQCIHSHDYRKPETFLNQKVMVYGAGPSGLDIAIEISRRAEHVILYHDQAQLYTNLPENVTQVTQKTVSLVEHGVEFGDKEIKAGFEVADNVLEQYPLDAIVFATGYSVDLDLLAPDCGVRVTQAGRVLDVYLHLINIQHPTMWLTSLPMRTLPFPLFHQQALVFVRTILTRDIRLPNKKEMTRWAEQDFKARIKDGFAERHAHKMLGRRIWEYEDYICGLTGAPTTRKVVRNIFDMLHVIRLKRADGYRKMKFQIISDTDYICSADDDQA